MGVVVPASRDEATYICLVCGRAYALVVEEDGIITLPDAAAFRQEHADCLAKIAAELKTEG
jgi:hypothetical protein